MWRPGWATTCRAGCCRRTWPYHSRLLPVTPGSAIRLRNSAASRLPAYLNWQAGVTFTHKAFNLDLRYYDTNLSKENCFVFTGDPNARPGGRVNLVHQPGRPGLELVRRDVRRQGLVCV